ncbi:MAG: Flp pilus assembly complex ATPase component TadA [Planctomycetes bacterium]|nr:Flp pilus assembly complex ATPase component TadA [Planctomycetota bacterium]
MANVAGYNRKLQSIMLEQELMSADQLDELYAASNKDGTYLSSRIIDGDFLDEISLIGLVSEDCGIPPIDLEKMNIDMEAIADLNKGELPLDEEEAKRFTMLPVALLGNNLTVAVANPYDVVTLDDIKIAIQKDIFPVLSTERAITNAIERLYNKRQQEMDDVMNNLSNMEGLDDMTVAEKSEDEEEGEADLLAQAASGSGDSPAVKLVNMYILGALNEGASDIHIEPFEKRTRVRYRVDGKLAEKNPIPKRLHGAVCSRIKIMCPTMNIAERFKPQDGRFQVKVGGNAIDFRVSILPLVHGEKVCIRILDKSNLAGALETMGFEPEVLDIVQRSIKAPYGMFLVTGPTGSGKSTTLYSALQATMDIQENVNTVEDPVEFEIDGLNQCQVFDKRGMSFAASLKSLLRQDPDIIMIGELRDTETMTIAIKAALTGHLVLSTLHTNDSTQTINRIVDMGIEPLMVSSTVLSVTAQRLGRRLCSGCKAKMDPADVPSNEELISYGFHEEELSGIEFYKAVGCSLCNKGYKGRFAMVEALEITKPVKKMILAGASSMDLRKVAIEAGMMTMRRCGLLNATRGITSLAEVLNSTVGDTEEE